MARLAAGTRKRTDGTLEKRFSINGRRYSIYGKTQKEISDKEARLRSDIENGLNCDKRTITLENFYTNHWLPSKERTIRERTLYDYKGIYTKHIAPKFGKKKLQKIERQEIIRFQNELASDLKQSTVNEVMRLLSQILKEAVKADIILKNPAESIKGLTQSTRARDTIHRALTIEEQHAFMNELKETNSYYYEFFALLLCTGMRSGEAAALSWNDIDYKNNVIHITKTVTTNISGNDIIGEAPKTSAGRRDIPMNETIKGILLSQKSKQRLFGFNNVLVFSGSTNNNILGNSIINYTIRATLKSLNSQGIYIEHFSVHALRDTFATRYIEQGGSPQTLKTILGHASLSMTMDLYAHVLPNTKQEEMNRILISI